MGRWTKPQNVVELLERSLERARKEENWEMGQWCFVPGLSAAVDISTLSDEEWEGYCDSARACAMGILLLEGLDGKFLKQYTKGQLTPESAIRGDAMISQAVLYLAEAIVGEPYDYLYLAIEIVMKKNDYYDVEFDEYGGLQESQAYQDKHKQIVGYFEKALDIAKGAVNA